MNALPRRRLLMPVRHVDLSSISMSRWLILLMTRLPLEVLVAYRTHRPGRERGERERERERETDRENREIETDSQTDRHAGRH